MPVYRNTMSHTQMLDGSLEELWSYLNDKDAQVALDPRLHRIDVVAGEWGKAGSSMVFTATNHDGATITLEFTMTEVNEPHSYATEHTFPDGTVASTHTFTQKGDQVEWHNVSKVTTRRLNLLEYGALKVTGRKVVQDFIRDVEIDASVYNNALRARRKG